MGLSRIEHSSTVQISALPPWQFVMPSIDVNIENEIKIKSKLLSVGRLAEIYIEQHGINCCQDGQGQQYSFQIIR